MLALVIPRATTLTACHPSALCWWGWYAHSLPLPLACQKIKYNNKTVSRRLWKRVLSN